MKNTDLIVNLEAMRRSGEFDPHVLLKNLGITHGKSIQMPVINSAIYLDCHYKEDQLPAFIEPYAYESSRFWG